MSNSLPKCMQSVSTLNNGILFVSLALLTLLLHINDTGFYFKVLVVVFIYLILYFHMLIYLCYLSVRIFKNAILGHLFIICNCYRYSDF